MGSIFLNGFWIFVGIVVGVLIELMVAAIKSWLRKRRFKKQLAFEFGCNLTLVKEWIAKLLELQSASAADNPHKFVYYFQTSKTISIVAKRLANEGILFDFLDFDDLRKILKTDTYLSDYGQNELNNKVSLIRDKKITKGEGDDLIEFWIKMFRELEMNLSKIKDKLEKSKI